MMEPTGLQNFWFAAFGALIIGYAILDGFDLGVGALSLFGRGGHERRLHLNAIGPVWDGNEVWLLAGGGALFAAFPIAYATVLSAFYLAIMLLLVALIARAVALEFRGKVENPRWQRFWDLAFGAGSATAALLFGVAMGNILRGLPLDASGTFTGSFLDLLHPYPLAVGLLTLVMFACHGAVYMGLKTDGELRERMRAAGSVLWAAWIVLYGLVTVMTIFVSPWLFAGVTAKPILWPVLALLFAALLWLPTTLRAGRWGRAFLCSSVAVGALVGLAGLSLYPRLAPSRTDPAFSLTIANASSSPRTLETMMIIALIGMPIVVAYTIYIYRQFKGRVEITESSY